MDEQNQGKELETGDQETQPVVATTGDGQIAKPEETSAPQTRYEDPHPPDGALYDTVEKIWVDRKNHVALRDQHPGEPNSDYVGKHDINDGDDVADGLKK